MIEEDILKLGGAIELSGFAQIDKSSMIILKKMIGNHVRKISDLSQNFQNIKLTMKSVHPTDASEIYEIKGLLNDNGKQFTVDHTERNLFVGVNKVLTKLENTIKK